MNNSQIMIEQQEKTINDQSSEQSQLKNIQTTTVIGGKRNVNPVVDPSLNVSQKFIVQQNNTEMALSLEEIQHNFQTVSEAERNVNPAVDPSLTDSQIMIEQQKYSIKGISFEQNVNPAVDPSLNDAQKIIE